MKLRPKDQESNENDNSQPTMSLTKQLGEQDTILDFPSKMSLIKNKCEKLIKDNWADFNLKLQLELQSEDPSYLKLACKILKQTTLKKVNNEFSNTQKQKFTSLFKKYREQTISIGEVNSFYLETKKILLIGGKLLNSNLIGKINEADVSTIIEYIERNPKYACHLIECIPIEKNKDLFSSMSKEKTEEILEHLTNKDTNISMEDFKKSIESFFGNLIDTPFKESLKIALNNICPSKELAIYENLLKSDQKELIREVAQESIPSFLIVTFPKENIRSALQGTPPELITEFIATLETEEQSTWLNIVAEEGSKLRELLDMELSSVNKDSIENKKYKIQKFFFNQFKNNYNNKIDVTNAIEQWLKRES